MDVTININAPAIVEAIEKLTSTMSAVLAASQPTTTLTTSEPPIKNAVEPVPLTAQYETFTPTAQTTQTAPIAPVQLPQAQTIVNTPPVANVAQTVAQPAPQPVMTPNPIPTQPVQSAPAPAPVIDESFRSRVCTAAARLIEQGKMSEVLAILKSFGVAAVTQLNATQLPEFANSIAALGAVI